MNADAPAEIWIDVESALPRDGYNRGGVFALLGRLRPGVSPAAAAEGASARLRRKVSVEAQGGGLSKLRQRFGRPVLILQAAALLVLLIGCANLANLLLAGAAARRREIAVRQAIGAGRGRLIRQWITESLLLAAIGGAFGIAAARWISEGLLRFLPANAQPALANLSFHPDGRVLAFTAAAVLAACILFGLAPAVRASRLDPSGGLKETAVSSRSTKWMSQALAIAEVALCTLLVCGAGMFVATLRNLRHLDAGFNVERVAMATVQAPGALAGPQLAAIFSELRRRTLRLPEVTAAGYSHLQQLSGFGIEEHVWREGSVRDAQLIVEEQRVSPGFFDAMGTPILGGRDFSERNDAVAPRVAILNESLARRLFPGQNPLGLRFDSDDSRGGGIEVAGVVKDAKWMNLHNSAPLTFYVPYAQLPTSYVTLAIRTTGDPRALAAQIAAVARDVEPRLKTTDASTFTEIEDRTLVLSSTADRA